MELTASTLCDQLYIVGASAFWRGVKLPKNLAWLIVSESLGSIFIKRNNDRTLAMAHKPYFVLDNEWLKSQTLQTMFNIFFPND